MVEGLIGDETGTAKYRIVGAFADLMEVGKVIAMRNGKSDVIDEYILL